MGFVTKTIALCIGNIAGIVVADRWISGFDVIPFGVKEVLLLGLILTALNIFVKPLLKLFLGPFIIITLGLGIIVVNALMLYILDIISENLTILNIPALAFGTLLISAINLLIHVVAKS